MAVTILTITIAGTPYNIKNDGSFKLSSKIDERSTCDFVVRDDNSAFTFQKGQQVTVSDTLQGTLFTGYVNTSQITKAPGTNTLRYHAVSCIDNHFLADKRTSNRVYNNQYGGVIVAGMINDVLSTDGVTANYAIREDNTQVEFGQGTLNGTQATGNLGGDLELASAGSTVSILENTTSLFNSGTLNGVTASGNTLAPTGTPTIKFVGTESLTNDANAYIYFQIFSSGAISVISGRYLEYDIWIATSSPEIKAGVDIIFTDGSTLRDLSQTYVYYDDQNIAPHPNRDQSGFANGAWRHRKFLLDNLAGKTISHVDVAIEGDKGGTYTVYIKNILYTNGSGTTVNTFFNGSLNTQKQMQNSGYSSISLSVVNTYDCSTANRVSPAYSLNNVGIAKDSFITWKKTTPTNTDVQVEYSLDGGSSYIQCTNNAALPNLLAGLSLSGKSIQFRQTFVQSPDAYPDAKPILTSMQSVIDPSYTATKSDVILSGATTAQLNAGTLSNTQASSNILLLLGAVRTWNTADLSNMTIFGGGASGTGPTTVRQHCNLGTLWVEVGINLEGRARLDFPGTWANGIFETDIYIDSTSGKPGATYRTTNWSNYDSNYAYCIECTLTSVSLTKGSNSSAASLGTRTVVASGTLAIASASWHRLKVIFNGSNHQIFIDDVQYINATDSTYTAAGSVALRASNSSGSAGYQGQFNNFGITIVGLSGTWVSPSQSLTSAGTYLGSAVTWKDVSINSQNTTILIESSTNGGSSWQTVTNGGSITSLTAGQSLSGVNLQLRATLTTTTASSMPQLEYLVCRVLGGFSSSGTRITPAFDLSPALIAGATVVNWNATTPNNTSVTVATSLDGVSYTNVANGGGIAGITAQPLATLDTFDTNLIPNYTNTNRTGGSVGSWLWDTLNSRLNVSGGTNALLLYTSVSCKDLDMIIDLDQADCVGLAWRVQDVSNFYELDIFDASSSAGSTNVVKLYKVVANVKTQLGSTVAISFTRGTPYRTRVKMVGTALTIWFDGNQVFSLTDSSLAGPGQVGLSEVSGVGRFYNFRVQPQGDSLSGKKVYCKVTLTSTDPTATPQLTDLTVAALNPNIALGSLIATASYENTFLSANFDDIAKKSNTYWQIDPLLNMIFSQYQSIPAPWILTDKNILVDGLQLTNNGDLYRNSQTLTGVVATGIKSETKLGDGTSTSWSLGGEIISPPVVYLNGQLQTIGIKGIDTGKNFYYTPGSNAIDQDASGTLLQQTDILLFQNYTYRYITSITINNTNLAGTITQKQFAALTGRTSATQIVLNQASAAKTVSGDAGDLTVSACRQISVDVNITAITGTSPTIQFFIDRKDINGIYYNQWSSSVINATGQVSTSIGAFALINQALGSTVRFRWTITGTSPSVTFSASILGSLTVQSAGLGIVESVEDVTDQALNITSATAYATSLLQRYGVIGNEIQFRTLRTGLAVGQYLPIFNPETSLNDASFLVTAIDMSRKTTLDVSSGQPTQLYFHDVTAESGVNSGSWSKLLAGTVN